MSYIYQPHRLTTETRARTVPAHIHTHTLCWRAHVRRAQRRCALRAAPFRALFTRRRFTVKQPREHTPSKRGQPRSSSLACEIWCSCERWWGFRLYAAPLGAAAGAVKTHTESVAMCAACSRPAAAQRRLRIARRDCSRDETTWEHPLQ